jgi:4-amino-4-deoxy-L-arabinose transferase-like glycosyltransferase
MIFAAGKGTQPGMGKKASICHPWLWMVLTAFALRFALILINQPYHFSDVMHHFRFGAETGSIARSVAEGEGFSSPFTGSTGPTAWIGPLYVYLCAAVFKLFGVFTPASAIILLSINSAFSALNAAVIYLVGKKICDKTVGLVAGWSWALIPSFMALCTTWVWETTLSALLITLALLLAIELCENASWRKWIGFGVFWGVAALINPALLSVFPISLAWISFRLRQAQLQYVKRITVTTLVCIATMSPWLIRNRVVFGQWVFIRSNFAFEFYLDNHDIPKGESFFSDHPTVSAAGYQQYKSMGEIAYVNLYRDKAKTYVREHPGAFLRKTGTRVAEVWTGGILPYLFLLSSPPADLQASALLSLIMFSGLFLAALNGVREWPFCAAVILLYPLPYYITHPAPRYRHPVEPIMLIMAAYFVVRVARLAHNSFAQIRQSRAAMPGEDAPCDANLEAMD